MKPSRTGEFLRTARELFVWLGFKTKEVCRSPVELGLSNFRAFQRGGLF